MNMTNTLLLFLLISLMIGCEKEKPKEIDTKSSAAKHVNKIEVTNPWARVGAANGNSALFFDIENNSRNNDTLVAANSNAASMVEIHETYKKEIDMIGMRKVDEVEIRPGESVKFKPRSLHVMLMKLKNDLIIGDTVFASLVFKTAGEIKIKAIVKDMNMNH